MLVADSLRHSSRMAKSTARKSSPGVKLGSLVKDRITGFKGIAIGRTEFAFGCVHIGIQAQQLTKDGDPIPPQYFDDQRVEVLAPPTKPWKEPKVSTIKPGDWVRDFITGATGTVTGRTVALDGRVSVIFEQPGLTDLGEPKTSLVTIVERIELVDRRTLEVSSASVATSGGPMARPVPIGE